MYVDDFICTYKLHEEECDKEIMYRTQFLQAFGLESWNDQKVEENMHQLYESIKMLKDVKEIIEKAKKSKELEMLLLFSGTEDKDVFKLLFKFELFDFTHRCICDAINKREISKNNKDILLNNL
jgi:hypothetical protein